MKGIIGKSFEDTNLGRLRTNRGRQLYRYIHLPHLGPSFVHRPLTKPEITGVAHLMEIEQEPRLGEEHIKESLRTYGEDGVYQLSALMRRIAFNGGHKSTTTQTTE